MRFNGQILGTATGFLVQSARGPTLLTNRHVVTGRDQDTGALLSKTAGVPNELVIWHNHHNRLGEWIAKVERLYVGDTPAWKEHPRLGARADIAALPLTQLDGVHVYAYDPANPGPEIMVGPADPVSVIGFPFGLAGGGLFGLWATGFVAMEPIADFADLPVTLIDCRSRQGQSGSPVISFRNGGAVAMTNGNTSMFAGPVWRLVGMYSGRINQESDLGIVWKVSALNELIAAC